MGNLLRLVKKHQGGTPLILRSTSLSSLSTFTRASTATVKDYESNIKNCLSGEARFKNGRRIENIAKDASNFTDMTTASWRVAGDGTIDSATTFSTGSASASGIVLKTFSGFTIGDIIKFTVMLSCTTNDQAVRIRVQDASTPFTPTSKIIYLTTDPKPFTVIRTIGVTDFSASIIENGTAVSGITLHGFVVQLLANSNQYGNTEMIAADADHGANVNGVKYFNTGNLTYQYPVIYGDSFADPATDLGYRVTQEANLQFHSSGVAGTTLAQIRAAMIAEAPYLTSDFVFLQGGINTIIAASVSPVAGMLADMALMVAHAVANNLGYIIYNLAPWGDNVNWTAEKEAWTIAYNAGVLAVYGTSRIVDMYTLVGDPSAPTKIKAEYDEDNLHINSAGERVVDRRAEVLLNEINPRTILTSVGFFSELGETNTSLQSEALGTSPWVPVGTTVTIDQSVAPDGTTTMDELIGDGNASSHYLRQSVSLTSGVTYAISVYAKKNVLKYMQITGGAAPWPPNVYANFDLDLGVVGTLGAGADNSYIEDMGNGVYRCTMVATADATTDINSILIALIETATSARLQSWTTSDSLYLWGNQSEPALSASSYVKTTTIAVARADDDYKISNVDTSGLVNPIEGTIVAKFIFYGAIAADSRRVFAFSNGTTGERMILGILSSGELGFYVEDGSVQQASLTLEASPMPDTVYQVAIRYRDGDFAASLDGADAVTDSSGTIPIMDTINIGSGETSNLHIGGVIETLDYEPIGRSNSALKNLALQ